MQKVFNIIEIDGRLSLRTPKEGEFRFFLAGLLRGAQFGDEATGQLWEDLPRMHNEHAPCSFNLPDGREVRLRKEQA
jgi:hypothetical protein